MPLNPLNASIPPKTELSESKSNVVDAVNYLKDDVVNLDNPTTGKQDDGTLHGNSGIGESKEVKEPKASVDNDGGDAEETERLHSDKKSDSTKGNTAKRNSLISNYEGIHP